MICRFSSSTMFNLYIEELIQVPGESSGQYPNPWLLFLNNYQLIKRFIFKSPFCCLFRVLWKSTLSISQDLSISLNVGIRLYFSAHCVELVTVCGSRGQHFARSHFTDERYVCNYQRTAFLKKERTQTTLSLSRSMSNIPGYISPYFIFNVQFLTTAFHNRLPPAMESEGQSAMLDSIWPTVLSLYYHHN